MEHRDLVGREMFVGDHVAYPTTHGSRARMTVARIEGFIDSEREVTKVSYDRHVDTRTTWKEIVKVWKVRLQPLYYNGSRYSDNSGTSLPRPVTVEKVENLVKVDLGEAWE